MLNSYVLLMKPYDTYFNINALKVFHLVYLRPI